MSKTLATLTPPDARDRSFGRLILVCWSAAAGLGLLSWWEPAWFLDWVQVGRRSEAQDYKALGDLALRQRDWGRAAAIYQRALAVNPDQGDAKGNLGIALLKAGRLDEAERILLERLSQDPQAEEISALHLATLEEIRGNRRAAAEWFQRSAACAAYPANALRQAGRLLLMEGRAQEALPLLERSLAAEIRLEALLEGMLKHRLPAGEDSLDRPLFQLRARGVAEADVAHFAPWVHRWISSRSRDVARSYYLLACAQAGVGAREQARATCLAALSCWPDYTEAKGWLAQLESKPTLRAGG